LPRLGFEEGSDVLVDRDPAAAIDPEVEAVLCALTYFAPSYEVTVDPFAIAHQKACALLAERGSTLAPNEIREAVESWR
jgi:hypothetical protein